MSVEGDIDKIILKHLVPAVKNAQDEVERVHGQRVEFTVDFTWKLTVFT